jgi:hypothetical protein
VLSYIVYDKGDSRHSVVLFLAGKQLSLAMPENTCRPVLAGPDEAAGAPTHVRHTQDFCIEAAASNRSEQIPSRM